MTLPVRPGWDRAAATFLDCAHSVAALVSEIDDPGVHGLGEWTVAELATHTLRSVTAPERYGAQPEPAGLTLGDAAGYFAAYLEWRDRDPAETDTAVAARARAEGDDPIEAWPAGVAAATGYIARADPDRRLATPFGAIRLVDYLPTRTVELVVHGFDLKAALVTDWEPPHAGATTTLAVLTAVSLRRGRAGDAIGLLTGRDWVDAPVLQ